MAFLRPQPTNLRDRLRQMTRSEWRFAGAAIGITAFFMIMFLIESRYGYSARPPRIVYFQSWPASDKLVTSADDPAPASAPSSTESSSAQ